MAQPEASEPAAESCTSHSAGPKLLTGPPLRRLWPRKCVVQDLIWPALEAQPLRALRAVMVCVLMGSILATALAFHFCASRCTSSRSPPSLTPRARPRTSAHHSEVTHFKKRFVAASGQTFGALQRSLNEKVVTTKLCAKQLAVFTYVDRANTTNYVTERVQDEGEDLIEVTRVRHGHWSLAVGAVHVTHTRPLLRATGWRGSS